jgi:DMSO/TMAO reductase YedYZ heme-binding membrane subunit
MSQVLLFTVVAIGLYFLTDWILRVVEERRGAPLPNRSLIFFVIILVLAVTSFEIIQRVLQGGPLF